MNFRKEFYTNAIWILVLVLSDRIVKLLTVNLAIAKDYGWISFDYTQNTGAIWGILQNQNTAFIWLSIAALGILLYAYREIPRLSFICIVAGIIGNGVDRIVYGFVIDMINLKWWPVFNVADSLVCIGVIIGIISIIATEFTSQSHTKKDVKKKRNA